MKHLLVVCISTVFVLKSSAQQPVSWTWNVKKISPDQYEIHLKAILQQGWHIYAQHQPKDAIATPTSIKFTKNPLLLLKGNATEIGKLEKYSIQELGIDQYQYSNEVEFVQTVTVKQDNLKTSISGSIVFQACTEEQCLPPKEVQFSLPL